MKATRMTMNTVMPTVRLKEDEPLSVLRSRPELGRGRTWRRETKRSLIEKQSSTSTITYRVNDITQN